MKISWYGHSCFKLKCKEIDLIIDPFDDSIGIKAPKVKAEVVLVTHNHEDHNNTKAISGDPIIINGPGEYEIKGVFIYGKQAYHDNKNGSESGLTTIYLIEEDGFKVAHLGDLGQKHLSEEQLEFLDDIDVLMLPIGGKYTLSASEAVELISEIEPRIIMPMHFKTPGLKMDIDGSDKFIKEINLKPEIVDEFKLSSETLPSDELKLVMLNKQ